MAKKNSEVAMEIHGAGDLPGVGNLADNPSALQHAIQNGRMAPQVYGLPEGGYIEGLLVCEGAGVETTSADGEAHTIPTWNIQLDNGITLALMSSHQLDRSLPALLGKRVFISRGAQKNVGSRRVNQFIVSDMSPKAGN